MERNDSQDLPDGWKLHTALRPIELDKQNCYKFPERKDDFQAIFLV